MPLRVRRAARHRFVSRRQIPCRSFAIAIRAWLKPRDGTARKIPAPALLHAPEVARSKDRGREQTFAMGLLQARVRPAEAQWARGSPALAGPRARQQEVRLIPAKQTDLSFCAKMP